MTDPYQNGLLEGKVQLNKFEGKGEIVAVANRTLSKRGLEITHFKTRVLRKDDIHELIVTVEPVTLGGKINEIAYLGFFKVNESFVIAVGDTVKISGTTIGHIGGFDETHAPNHINIVVCTDKLIGGIDMGLKTGMAINIGNYLVKK